MEHIRKYPILPSVSTGRIKKPVMLLIDDIPMATGKASSGRLRSCLHILARSAHVPTIFLMTEYAMDEGGASMSTQRELVESMQEAGACKVMNLHLSCRSLVVLCQLFGQLVVLFKAD